MSMMDCPIGISDAHKKAAPSDAQLPRISEAAAGTTTPQTPDPGPAHISKFPSEVVDIIFSRLSLADIKSVRLLSKQWAECAARYLFATFVLRLDRPDVERLELITAESPHFLTGIKRLRFDLSKFGLKLMIEWLRYLFEVHLLKINGADEDLNHEVRGWHINRVDFKYLVADAMDEYARWSTGWHNDKQDWFTRKSLKTLLGRVSLVEHIEITTRNTPFKNPFNIDAAFYNQRDDQQKQDSQDIAHFINLLEVLRTSAHNITSFSHDGLPTLAFRFDETIITNMAMPLRFLTTLRITTNGQTCPEPRLWKNFGQFMTALPLLKDLRFGSSSYEELGVWTSYGLNDSHTDIENIGKWYVPLWQVLGNHTWNHLETLRLDGLLLCETGLLEFMSRHRSTLRNLELSDVALWSGTFRSLLTEMRDTLNLERFFIRGAARAFHSDVDSWYLNVPQNLTREIWSEELKLHFDEHHCRTVDLIRDANYIDRHEAEAMIQLLANYVTRRHLGPWPISSQKQGYYYNPYSSWSHHSSLCQDCIKPRHEVDDLWTSQSQSYLVAHKHFDAKDPLVAKEEERIIDFYPGGYDFYGFDKNGFDSTGGRIDEHYRSRTSEYEGEIPIAMCTRLFRDEILSRIPRYAEHYLTTLDFGGTLLGDE